jgi:uncharacterized repeat protein (TIGR01451 family)
VNPFQSFNAGNYDVTVARIGTGPSSSDVSVTMSGPAGPVNPGDNVTYTVNVTNGGPNGAAHVRLVDIFPVNGVVFVTGTPTQGTCSAVFSNVFWCDFGSLASLASASASISATVGASAGTTLTNRVSVSSDVSDPNGANNAAAVSTTVNGGSPPPTLASVTPGCAGIAGGKPVIVAGTGFLSGATLTLAGVPATVTSVTGTEIQAQTPAYSPGSAVTGSAVVTNLDGLSASLAGAFGYAVRGDANDNGSLTFSDVTYLNFALFAGGPAPTTPCNGDANSSGTITFSDVTYLNNYLFAGGPPPGQ